MMWPHTQPNFHSASHTPTDLHYLHDNCPRGGRRGRSRRTTCDWWTGANSAAHTDACSEQKSRPAEEFSNMHGLRKEKRGGKKKIQQVRKSSILLTWSLEVIRLNCSRMQRSVQSFFWSHTSFIPLYNSVKSTYWEKTTQRLIYNTTWPLEWSPTISTSHDHL